MDIKKIHTTLTQAWPNGVSREDFVPLAGMVKVLIDQAEKRASDPEADRNSRKKLTEESVAEWGTPSKTAPYTAPSSASGTEARESVYNYVSKNPGTLATAIAQDLNLPFWAIGMHLRYFAKKGQFVRSADLVPNWRTVESVTAPVLAPAPAVKSPRGVPFEALKRVVDYLRGATSIGAQSRTRDRIMTDLGLGEWTVRRALWQLQREGKITRINAVQGPHLYRIKK